MVQLSRWLSRGREALGAPIVTRWSWLAALLSAAPALALGYVLDDLQQQSMLRGTYDSAARSGGELYCFSLGPGRGINPAILSWWDQPNSSLCFLRPLSSWSLFLDHAYLWRWPALPHLHSVLWFMGLWLAWRAILLRYLPARVANLGLLLMAASSSIAMTVAWIASRHALVGGCFGVWGLYHCLVSRDRSGAAPRAREVLGWLLIGLGLLSSEMVLGVFGFLVAREWLTRASDDNDLRPGAIARIAAYAACGVGYVGVHAKLGYGAPEYPLYLNPAGDPGAFLRALPERVLSLLADLLTGLPSDAWVYPALKPLCAVIAMIAAAVLALAVRRLFTEAPEALRRPLRWLGLGGLLSMAPCLSGMPGGRALTIAGFAFFAIIAACLLLPADPERGHRRRTRSLVLGLLFAGACVGNPAAHAAWYFVLDELDRTGEQAFDARAMNCPPNSDLYLLDASNLGAAAWYARYWLKDKVGANRYRQLTMSPLGFESIELVRTGPASMTLRSRGAPLVGELAIPPGNEGEIQVGYERSYPDYSVRVTRVSERGPIEADFVFSRPLDAPDLCLFVHDDEHLYQLEVPAVGGSARIASRPLVYGLSAARPVSKSSKLQRSGAEAVTARRVELRFDRIPIR